MAKKNTTSTTTYLNGWFVTEKEGNYGKYLSVGITEEGLEALKSLEASASGFRNITLSPQKNDPTKYSVKPFVPKQSSSAGDSTDDLPF